ncbi:MAG TPA: metallophosphoesterase [Candidatus Sulfotelmatobacter sp.]|nr:metallophosphoesterase [Candidatus Sulfotelmatobacter sp.]
MQSVREHTTRDVMISKKTHLSTHIQAGKMAGQPVAPLLLRGCAGLISFLLGLGLLPWSAAAAPVEPQDRIIAIGDIHGELDSFCRILRRAHVVDEQNHWIGGSTTLVQTGDVIDRGPKGREAMDLLMTLETEAARAGGRVVALLGNHEVMNLLGDPRYVTPPNYAAFADNDSEKRRQAAYREYSAWLASKSKSLAAIKQPIFPTSEETWMSEHPAGFLEYREAFRPDGKYGRWIRQHDAVTEIEGIIFLHGGIAPALISMSLEKINSQIREEIDTFDKTMRELQSRKIVLPFFTLREIALAVQLQLVEDRSAQTSPDADFHNRLVHLLDVSNWLCMRDEGPLWFRGYDAWSDDAGVEQISKILPPYHAGHIVVAHTVQKGPHIRSRFDGKVFLIDTGMVYKDKGGAPSALDIQAGKFTAIYLDGQDALFDDKSPKSGAKGN